MAISLLLNQPTPLLSVPAHIVRAPLSLAAKGLLLELLYNAHRVEINTQSLPYPQEQLASCCQELASLGYLLLSDTSADVTAYSLNPQIWQAEFKPFATATLPHNQPQQTVHNDTNAQQLPPNHGDYYQLVQLLSSLKWSRALKFQSPTMAKRISALLSHGYTLDDVRRAYELVRQINGLHGLTFNALEQQLHELARCRQANPRLPVVNSPAPANLMQYLQRLVWLHKPNWQDVDLNQRIERLAQQHVATRDIDTAYRTCKAENNGRGVTVYEVLSTVEKLRRAMDAYQFHQQGGSKDVLSDAKTYVAQGTASASTQGYSAPEEATHPDVLTVFAYWQQLAGSDSPLDYPRKQLIASALQSFSVEQIRKAILNAHGDSFVREKGLFVLSYLLKNNDTIERLLSAQTSNSQNLAERNIEIAMQVAASSDVDWRDYEW